MNSWKVENPGKLLNEVKNKFSGLYTLKDLKWSIEHSRCFVNHKREIFSSALLQKGDHLFIDIEKKPRHTIEQGRILYEDADIFIYNKPPFLTSEEVAKLSGYFLTHRLDRDTSGLLLLAKQIPMQRHLEDLFRKRKIHKEYLAVVEGFCDKAGAISGYMAVKHRQEGRVLWAMSDKGLWSKTEWRAVASENKKSLLLCVPLTGRTHQIRVHLKSIGHPIMGDYTYGSPYIIKGLYRPLLHAFRLKFTHPGSGKKIEAKSKPPQDFLSPLSALRRGCVEKL